MNKVKKIALILLIWLLTIFFISVAQSHPISISQNTASLFQIPVIFWIVMLASPFLLYLIAKDSKNPLVSLVCVILYYFLFFSFGLYFMSHPATSDIQSSAGFQAVLSTITHIGPQEINIEPYFMWPIFFIFSKIFTSILGIGPIQTINLGFFSLLLILPVLLSLFYKGTNKVENATIYLIFPALYLTLGYHFINAQFVPQFLALIYLFILFGFYLKYRRGKNPLFILLMVIFYALTVSTHAFMFIFFLVAMIFEIYWSEYIEMKRNKVISYGLIIIFFAILYPYIGIYYSFVTYTTGGESWRIFERFFSERTPIEVGYQMQKLYHLVPGIYDQLLTSIGKFVLVAVFFIATIGFLFYIFKKRKLFDLSLIVGSASWFALGLSGLVLGQRAVQVAALPLARHFKYPHKLFSYLSKVVVIIILIAPSLFITNHMMNSSIGGDGLVQDPEENIAGRFMDRHITNESFVLFAQNAYPTGYPSGFEKIKLINIIRYKHKYGWEKLDFVLESPKLQKQLDYLNIKRPKDHSDSFVYNNEDIKLVFK
ncbi:MAG: hypothetical protein ACOC56_02230 [Atribacterota bacterium]